MSSVETEPPPPHPSPRGQRRSAVFIATFVALQFFVPLTYLTRDDPSDQRFTWRLQAQASQPRCEASAEAEHLDGSRQSLAIETLIHRAWVQHVERGRKSVIDAFLRKQCAAENVVEVTLVNECKGPADSREYRLRCGSARSYEAERTAAR